MNYLMIGGDGKTYGPVTTEQVRAWFAEGRLNAETKLAEEGTGNWRPLSEWPEFQDLLLPLSQPAAASAVPPPVKGAALTAEILAHDYQLDIGACFSRSWQLVRSDFWSIVGVTLVSMLLMMAVGLIPFVGSVASILLTGVITGGMYGFFLRKIRGQEASLGDLFAGFNGTRFLPLMLTGLLVSVLTVVGFLCCILPGIYLSVAWYLAIPLAFDKGFSPWDAMETSRKVLSRHWWLFFAFGLLSGLVGILGFLCCIVGVFVAIPVCVGAMAYAYEDIFG